MYLKTIKGCLAIALTFGLQSVCSAQDSVTTMTTTTAGPPVVLDSYMKPTVVRSRETIDADGNTQRTTEPLVWERHEHVMLPATETTSTLTQRTGVSTAVKTESRRVAQRTTSSVVKRKVAHRPRYHAANVRRNRVAVAQKVTVTQRQAPLIIEEQESSVTRATVIERRHPALDL